MPEPRHRGPVLGAWHMAEANRVPEHEVAAVDRALCRHPFRQAVAVRVLVAIRTGGKALIRSIGTRPQRISAKSGANLDRVVRREDRDVGMSGQKLIAGRITLRIS